MRILVLFLGLGIVFASGNSGLAHAGVQPLAIVSSVAVSGDDRSLEVKIISSQPVTVHSQDATGPDRLVLDFPNALPARRLRNLPVQSGRVKRIRVGLFASNPPVTRVVLDLEGPQPYQIFPSGRTVLVKFVVGEAPTVGRPQLSNAVYIPPPAQVRKMEIEYHDGLLAIQAVNVSLAEVLDAIRVRTGTEISAPPMAAQDSVVTSIGPSPMRDALTALLNGSRFNFILVGSEHDPSGVTSVILTPRGGGISQPSPPEVPVVETQPEPEPEPQPEMQTQDEPPVAAPAEAPAQETPPQQETIPPPENNPPQ